VEVVFQTQGRIRGGGEICRAYIAFEPAETAKFGLYAGFSKDTHKTLLMRLFATTAE